LEHCNIAYPSRSHKEKGREKSRKKNAQPGKHFDKWFLEEGAEQTNGLRCQKFHQDKKKARPTMGERLPENLYTKSGKKRGTQSVMNRKKN